MTVANGLDVNGDGYADVAVGAPDENRVYVFMGGASGPGAGGVVEIRAPMPGMFGWVVASAGDGRDPRCDDLIVTAPAAGRVFVYACGTTGMSTVPARVIVASPHVRSFGIDARGDGCGGIIVGSGSGGVFTSGSGTVGDVNGDGFEDHAAVDRWRDKPMVRVFAGGVCGTLETVPGRSPYAVAGVGDVNGDGLDDVAVGNSVEGTVAIHLGSPDGLHTSPDTVLSVPVRSFGWSVAGLSPGRTASCGSAPQRRVLPPAP